MMQRLPSIDSLLRAAPDLSAEFGHAQAVQALRQVVDAARQAVRSGGGVPDAGNLVAQAALHLAESARSTLRPVINATGVIVHTNLGRAPLSEAALAAVAGVGGGYSTLEYDLEPGMRGKRDTHVARILAAVTGAEAGLVVNNNAAGVLLALMAFAQGREAIISRGQLIEIGGSFRIPDVMAQSGARMVEVGATNRTHLRDYENAITPETALIVYAHTSNYKIVGFTESVPLPDLAELAHRHGLLLLADIGSGALIDPAEFGLSNEPTAQEALAAGADLVLFSGDKLLGATQAGIIIGRAGLVDTLKRHPLARAIRADKLCIAGLVATLQHYQRGEALQQVPVWRMISAPAEEIRGRATAWAAALADRGGGSVVASESTVGGGTLPGETLPTWAFAPVVDHPNEAAARLRRHDPPVIARVTQDQLLLDPRTVLPGQDDALLAALKAL